MLDGVSHIGEFLYYSWGQLDTVGTVVEQVLTMGIREQVRLEVLIYC
jgi:hypothetical protein